MKSNPKIVLSPFCKERDQASCKIPLENIVSEVAANFPNAKQGYRDGVLLVPINPTNFVSQIVQLQDGDRLTGKFKRRKENETPRKEIRVPAAPGCDHSYCMPLVAVDVVLYSNSVLLEGKENSDMSADYEIITILTKVSYEDQPMPPETLMANNFMDSGGTQTHMSDEEFVLALKASYNFWKNKAIIQIQ